MPSLAAGWTDGAVGAWSNAPSIRVAWKVATGSSETCTGWTNAVQTHCFVFRKAGGIPAFGTATFSQGALASTTTIDWDGVTISNGLVLAALFTIAGDTGALRAALNALDTGISGASSDNLLYNGVSDLTSSWTSTTGTKTNTAGRWDTIEIPIT